jgi:hypothetical protein
MTMTTYRCTAWALQADGSRQAQVTETIPEAELSTIFVLGARMLGLTQDSRLDVPTWLATCEFARRAELAPELWRESTLPRKPTEQAAAEKARTLPVIIRVEAQP